MIKKSLIVVSISAAFFLNAQDVSVIKNTTEIYSGSNNVGSAKYNSMAGSMGALGGDASTLISNPAGIGVAISSTVSGTLSFENNSNSSSLAGGSKTFSTNKFNLGNFGGVATFQLLTETPWKFVNVGANFSTQSIEDYIETPGNNNLIFPIVAAGDNLSYERHAYDRTGDVNKMNIGVSANYDNRIYIGAGLNFHNSQIDQFDIAQLYSSLNNSSDIYHKQYTPFSEISNGFSGSVGIIGKVNQQFRLGASIETPTWWNIERAYNYYESPSDGSAGEDRFLTTPMKATLSAAFVPNKNFALNVDYMLGVTKPKYKEYGVAEVELNDFFNENYKNVSEVRVGAEYRIEQFRLRGGYAMTTNPFDAILINDLSVNGATSTKSYSDLILGKRNTFALGLGYDFPSMFVDLGYQNVSSQYSNPFLQGSSMYNSGYFGNAYIVESDAYLVSDVKNSKNNIYFTVGWKF